MCCSSFGTCTIDANQAGSAAYDAAPQAQQTITTTDCGDYCPSANSTDSPTTSSSTSMSDSVTVAGPVPPGTIFTVESYTSVFTYDDTGANLSESLKGIPSDPPAPYPTEQYVETVTGGAAVSYQQQVSQSATVSTSTISFGNASVSDFDLNLNTNTNYEIINTFPTATSFTVAANGSTTGTVADGSAATLSETGLPAAASGPVTFSAGGRRCVPSRSRRR